MKLKLLNKMGENTLFLLVFILFLPDYLLFPALLFALTFVVYEFFKYKGFEWSFFWLLFAYLILVSLSFKNYKGFFGAIFLFLLLAYSFSIKRRMNAKTYMEMQFFIVWSSLFNFFFNFISWKPSWYSWMLSKMSVVIDFGKLPVYGEGYLRAYSTFDNPNFYAFILMIVLLICFNQLQFQLTFKNYPLVLFYSGAFIINMYALILTGTRSILIALVLGLLVIVISQEKWMQLKVLVFLGAAFVFLVISKGDLLPRFMELSEHSGIRFRIWKTSVDQIRLEPWFGKGLFTYEFLFDRADAHNIFIESVLSMGVFGSFIFLIFSGEKVYRLYSKAYYLDYPLVLAVLSATLLYGVFDIPLFGIQTSMLFVAVLCLPLRDKEDLF